jgi:hypothetical protein
MEITAKQYQQALKKYNEIMNGLCYEHNTIGTALSEGTANWNLRDMVAECDYVLSTFYEDGHLNGDMRYSDDADERRQWTSDTGKLKRFIAHWLPYISEMACAEGHCSQYDNEQSEPDEEYTGEHYVGEIVSHKGGDMTHECIVTAVWCVDGKNGLTIKPTGNYGFELDIYEEQL